MNNFFKCFHTGICFEHKSVNSTHIFLSSTLGSIVGSGSWPLSLVLDSKPIVGVGSKSKGSASRSEQIFGYIYLIGP